jgi:hypothetical protein
MGIVTFKCHTCDEEKERFDWLTPCHGDMCCSCCIKEGLAPERCKLNSLELERMSKGEELNENELKGIFLERAMSNTLRKLEVPHKHNPFTLCYSSYQTKNPDITIEALNAVIECKNLKQEQVNFLSEQWLDKNVILRPKTSGYTLKLALFSYKPRKNLAKYLKSHGWRSYGLGFQILNEKQEKKAIPRLKQQFWWLRKAYNQKHNST